MAFVRPTLIVLLLSGCHSRTKMQPQWDLSSEQAINKVISRTSQWRPDRFGGGEAYITVERDAMLKLPNHKAINRYIRTIWIKESPHVMTIVDITFENQSINSARRLARNLCKEWNLPTQKIDAAQWLNGQLERGPVEVIDSKSYPMIQVNLIDSFDNWRPAKVQLTFTWLSPKMQHDLSTTRPAALLRRAHGEQQ